MELIEIVSCVLTVPAVIYIVIDAMVDRSAL